MCTFQAPAVNPMRWGTAVQYLLARLVVFHSTNSHLSPACITATNQVLGNTQVQELYEITPGLPWSADERRESRIVFIGRRLDATLLRAALESCTSAS